MSSDIGLRDFGKDMSRVNSLHRGFGGNVSRDIASRCFGRTYHATLRYVILVETSNVTLHDVILAETCPVT